MDIYIVYDRGRTLPDGRMWRVATFKKIENARKFLDELRDENCFISKSTATVADIAMLRDK
jgi:hypothetical protein